MICKQAMIQPKYRLWDCETEIMYQVTAIHWDDVGGNILCIEVDSEYEGTLEFIPDADDFSLMLDTGVEDSKGELAYELDVIKDTDKMGEVRYSLIFTNFETLQYQRCIAGYQDGIFDLRRYDILNSKIIGNVFENEELRTLFDKFLKESSFYGLGHII